ncbi:hypothetical protein ACFE04_002685 [Oxalis oulophora]
MDRHENKEKTQQATRKGHKQTFQDAYFAPNQTVDEPKIFDKKEERELNRNCLDELRIEGAHGSGKPSETKETREKTKERMGTEEVELENKGIIGPYQEQSKPNMGKDYEKEVIKENKNPNGTNAVDQSVIKKTEITEKKREETESKRKHNDEQKTKEGSQQKHHQAGKPIENKRVQNIPNEKETEEKEKKEIKVFVVVKDGRTKDTEAAQKGIVKSHQEQSKAHQEIAYDTEKDYEKEIGKSNKNPFVSKGDESLRQEGNQQEHDRTGKPIETKLVQNIPNEKETGKKKENIEGVVIVNNEITDDTELGNKGILEPDKNQSKVHDKSLLGPKHGIEKDSNKENREEKTNPNRSKPDKETREKSTELDKQNDKNQMNENPTTVSQGNIENTTIIAESNNTGSESKSPRASPNNIAEPNNTGGQKTEETNYVNGMGAQRTLNGHNKNTGRRSSTSDQGKQIPVEKTCWESFCDSVKKCSIL